LKTPLMPISRKGEPAQCPVAVQRSVYRSVSDDEAKNGKQANQKLRQAGTSSSSRGALLQTRYVPPRTGEEDRCRPGVKDRPAMARCC